MDQIYLDPIRTHSTPFDPIRPHLTPLLSILLFFMPYCLIEGTVTFFSTHYTSSFLCNRLVACSSCFTIHDRSLLHFECIIRQHHSQTFILFYLQFASAVVMKILYCIISMQSSLQPVICKRKHNLPQRYHTVRYVPLAKMFHC